MTNFDDQPPVYVEDCYRWLGQMIGRAAGLAALVCLGVYVVVKL